VKWSSSGLGTAAGAAAVTPFAQSPAGPLARTELPVGVDRPARPFEIGRHGEAVLAAAQPVAFRGLHLNLVHAGPQRIARPRYEIVTLADFNLGIARAVSVEAGSVS